MERSRGIARNPNPLRADSPAVYAQVLPKGKLSDGIDLDNWQCDVRVFSGEIIRNVRLPGGYVDRKQNAHGVFGEISENQLVLVEFAFGSSQNPIIVKGFPYFTNNLDADNLSIFLKKKKFKKSDIAVFHSSGFSVWMKDYKIEVYLDTNPSPVFSLDLKSNKMTLQMSAVFGQGTVNIPNGNLLLSDLLSRAQFETEVSAALTAIRSALVNSPVAPLDGGATYKAGISLALNTLQIPNAVQPPADLNKTSLKMDTA